MLKRHQYSALLLIMAASCSYGNYFHDRQQHKYQQERRDYSGSEPRVTHASFPHSINPPGNSYFIFDPNQLAWAAYNASGELVKTGVASGGQSYCPDIHRACKTPRGLFRIYAKGGPGCVSTKFPIGRGGAPMPYCMYFHGGFAVHGSYEVPDYNASHGCIRLIPEDAEWLSKNFMTIGTTVRVVNY